MGWAVGWDQGHQRHRGYGVPAYCDAKDCSAEIDRGLSYVAVPPLTDDEYDEWDDLADGTLFVCVDHEHADVDPDHLPTEHPRWIAHVLTDSSWSKWRDENPAQVATLRDEQRYVARQWVTDEAWQHEEGRRSKRRRR
jgi:hypothetical protein